MIEKIQHSLPNAVSYVESSENVAEAHVSIIGPLELSII